VPFALVGFKIPMRVLMLHQNVSSTKAFVANRALKPALHHGQDGLSSRQQILALSAGRRMRFFVPQVELAPAMFLWAVPSNSNFRDFSFIQVLPNNRV
jgi:hypothetical protein